MPVGAPPVSPSRAVVTPNAMTRSSNHHRFHTAMHTAAPPPGPARESATLLYRGVVSHKRWRPAAHGFAYEIFMVALDVDRFEAAFAGIPRPLAAVNSRWALATVSEADHMKLSRKPRQPLGDAVRDAVEAATSWRPPAGCRIQLLTMPAILGYSFNPVSFYYVWAEDGSRVDTVIAEVTNTPW